MYLMYYFTPLPFHMVYVLLSKYCTFSPTNQNHNVLLHYLRKNEISVLHSLQPITIAIYNFVNSTIGYLCLT